MKYFFLFFIHLKLELLTQLQMTKKCRFIKIDTWTEDLLLQYPEGGGPGVFVAGKLFISTGLGSALKSSPFITCLYKTVLEVNYLFHAELDRNYFKKNPAPPPASLVALYFA